MSYPERFLFFDSESYVEKPDAEATYELFKSSALTQPHAPRLICAQYWERNPETGQYHKKSADRGGQPIFRNDGAFREADYGGPFGTRAGPHDKHRDGTGPFHLCQDFWRSVDACASWTVHGKNHTKLTLVAHNVGYDMLATGAYVHLPSFGWKMEHPYHKGPVYIQRAKKGQHVIEILSSTNYWAASLHEVGKTFGVEKIDFKDFNTPVFSLLEEYCRQDVEVCARSITWLAQSLFDGDKSTGGDSLGPWKATISSIAFASWRYRFMEEAPEIHTDPVAMRMERAAFCGGHTEAWYIGDINGEVHDYDVNNLYGWVMSNYQLPVRLLDIRHDLTPSDLEGLVEAGELLISDVTVDMDEAAVPRKEVKLLFCTGEFRVTLATPELRLALKHGRILKVHETATYAPAPLFRSFCNYMSAKRVEAEKAVLPDGRIGDKAKRAMYKAMNNHVYGKMGQMAEEWVRIGDAPLDALPHREVTYLDDGKNTEVVTLTMPGSVYQMTGEKVESYNSFPAVAAFITSYARARLWKLRSIANGRDGRHVFYCDTDSIFTDHVGRERLEAAGEVDHSVLGKVKHEWEGVRLTIGGAKWYSALIPHEGHPPGKGKEMPCLEGWALDERGGAHGGVDTRGEHLGLLVRHKGVPERAVLVDTPTGPMFAYQQFPGLDGHIGLANVGQFRNRRILKKSVVEYSKAIVPEGGGWVRAFRLPEDAVAGLVPSVLAE